MVVSLPWPPRSCPTTPARTRERRPSSRSRLVSSESWRPVERVVVGLEDDGRPVRSGSSRGSTSSGSATTSSWCRRPVLSVLPGPGTESQPGRRAKSDSLEGSARDTACSLPGPICVRPRASGSLPLRVRVRPKWTAPHSSRARSAAATARDADRGERDGGDGEGPSRPSRSRSTWRSSSAGSGSAIQRDVFAEGSTSGPRRRRRSQQACRGPAAPRRHPDVRSRHGQVPGTPDGTVPISARLDGQRRSRLRLVLRGRASNASAPRLDLRVKTGRIPDTVKPSQSPRARLAVTIALELGLRPEAPVRHVPRKPRGRAGPSSTTYVLQNDCGGAACLDAGSRFRRRRTSHGRLDRLSGYCLVAGLPAAAVIWAHS